MKLLITALLPILCFAQPPTNAIKIPPYAGQDRMPIFLPADKSRPPFPIATNYPVVVGERSFACGKNCVVVGRGAASTNDNSIVIGRNAVAHRDNELVIKFTDGTELRQLLPPGKVIDHGLYDAE